MDEPLDPATRRRADAVPGYPVTLLDGRDWEIPDVAVEFAEADGRAGFRYVSNISPDYEAALMGYLYPEEDDPMPMQARALRLAGELLRRNYRVTREETGRLIRFRAPRGEDLTDPLRDDLMDLALGQGKARPKGSGTGSPSGSGSPG